MAPFVPDWSIGRKEEGVRDRPTGTSFLLAQPGLVLEFQFLHQGGEIVDEVLIDLVDDRPIGLGDSFRS
ncbi:hypothetical protein [Nocardia sp. NPDC050717]|uniref:hypothetical protein n=1 Tax=Nocardia sp. NPDC050717 TaxID=3157221 RepID=UPI0033C8F837